MDGKLKTIFVGGLVVIAIGMKLYREWSEHQIPKSDGSISRMENGQFADKFTKVKKEGAGLELLKNCKLITGRNSDGDSFHVKHGKDENEFRLYFVDTPESKYKEYGRGQNNGKRLDQQAKYFGEMGRDEVAKVGADAKAFVLGILKEKPFEILTKWEGVHKDPARQHAFVIVEWEGREVYLHELLVAQGLVRVHTYGADLPGGKGWKQQREYLETWEKKVKKAGIGAWGM